METDRASQDVPMIAAPDRLGYRLLAFTEADLRVLGVVACAILAASQMFGPLGVLGIIAFSMWLLWPLKYARRYYTWLEALYGFYIRVVLRDRLWENPELIGADKKLPRGEKLRAVIDRIVPRPHPFPFRVDQLYDIGLVHCVSRRTDTLYLRGDGSNIASLGMVQQAEWEYRLAYELRKIATTRGYTVEIGMTLRRRPADPADHMVVQDQSMQPAVLVPDAFDDRTHLGEDDTLTPMQVRALRARRIHQIAVVETGIELEEAGCVIDMDLAITVKRSPRLRRAASEGRKSRKVDAKTARREQIVQLAKVLQDAMAVSGVQNARILNPGECEQSLRRSWDVVGLLTYYLGNNHKTSLPQCHPQAGIYACRDKAVFDQSGCVTIRVTELPRLIPPVALERLFTEPPVPWISRTVVAESGSGNQEYYGLNFLSAVVDSLLSAFTIRWGTRTIRRRERLAKEETRVADEGHVMYTNMYIAILDDDPYKLEDHTEATLRIIRGIGGQGQIVQGRARTVRAALTAVTAINLL